MSKERNKRLQFSGATAFENKSAFPLFFFFLLCAGSQENREKTRETQTSTKNEGKGKEVSEMSYGKPKQEEWHSGEDVQKKKKQSKKQSWQTDSFPGLKSNQQINKQTSLL